jgi:aryl-alcohol dehydrogenase-like predicted oxidoreductase
MFDFVSCTIPGARRPTQADENVGAGELPALSAATMQQISEIYDRSIRPQVHDRW